MVGLCFVINLKDGHNSVLIISRLASSIIPLTDSNEM